jgi:hypothetical protein
MTLGPRAVAALLIQTAIIAAISGVGVTIMMATSH